MVPKFKKKKVSEELKRNPKQAKTGEEVTPARSNEFLSPFFTSFCARISSSWNHSRQKNSDGHFQS